MIKSVIIDFDDTLCLTELASFKLENEVLRKMGRPPQDRMTHKRTWGAFLFDVIRVRSPGVDVASFQEVFGKTMPEWVASKRIDAVAPENLKTLDRLIEGGKQLFILTSRSHSEFAHILAPDHELAAHIKAFYYRDVMEYHKPDPRAFDLLLNDQGFTRAECVYVGDSPGDAAAAKKGGMHFIASLESGLRACADFDEYQVDAFIHAFPELVLAVQQLAAA